MKPARHLISLVALLCFGEVALPDAAAQQTDELRKEFQNTKAKAEKGDAAAQSNLGFMYGKVEGVAKDELEAVKWFRKAADQGNAGAQFNLGNMYYKGRGVEKDYAEAVKWFRLASDQGSAEAKYNRAICYKEGQGVPPDEKEFWRWLHASAEHGGYQAQMDLAGHFEAVGDYVEAYAWLEVHLSIEAGILENAMTSEEIAQGKRRARTLTRIITLNCAKHGESD